jgi:hypothetical protein
LGCFAATCCDVGNCVTHSVGNNTLLIFVPELIEVEYLCWCI